MMNPNIEIYRAMLKREKSNGKEKKATVEPRNDTELKLVLFKKRKWVNETHHYVCCRAIIGLHESILEGMAFLRGGCQIVGTV